MSRWSRQFFYSAEVIRRSGFQYKLYRRLRRKIAENFRHVTASLRRCRNQNFVRRVTRHMGCRTELNGTVILYLFRQMAEVSVITVTLWGISAFYFSGSWLRVLSNHAFKYITHIVCFDYRSSVMKITRASSWQYFLYILYFYQLGTTTLEEDLVSYKSRGGRSANGSTWFSGW